MKGKTMEHIAMELFDMEDGNVAIRHDFRMGNKSLDTPMTKAFFVGIMTLKLWENLLDTIKTPCLKEITPEQCQAMIDASKAWAEKLAQELGR
jgi:hypothetical protein